MDFAISISSDSKNVEYRFSCHIYFRFFFFFLFYLLLEKKTLRCKKWVILGVAILVLLCSLFLFSFDKLGNSVSFGKTFVLYGFVWFTVDFWQMKSSTK